MYIVRETFIAKPGCAGKLAKMLKEGAPEMANQRVMIDFVSRYNKIVMEYEVKNLAEFEKMLEGFKSNPEMKAKMAGYTDLYKTGKREIFKVV